MRAGPRDEVGGKLIVACSDLATLLDPIEEPFDPVTGAVEIRAEADWIGPIAFGGDVGLCVFLHGELPNLIGVVATVGKQHCPGFQMRQECSSRSIVMGHNRWQCQPYG
jgi:hypothetical protein